MHPQIQLSLITAILCAYTPWAASIPNPRSISTSHGTHRTDPTPWNDTVSPRGNGGRDSYLEELGITCRKWRTPKEDGYRIQGHIEELLLNKYDLDNPIITAPGYCVRHTCWQGTAVYLCNDRNVTDTSFSVARLGAWVAEIHMFCAGWGSEKALGGLTAIVSWGQCNEQPDTRGRPGSIRSKE